MSAWIALGLIVVAGVVFMLMDAPGETFGVTDSELGTLVASVALLIWIGSSAIYGYRGRASLALKQAVVWLAIALMLLVTYTYRDAFTIAGQKVAAQLLPGTVREMAETNTSQPGSRVVAVTSRQGNQFRVETLVDGTHVNMLADTGATLVALSDSDARRIGVEPNKLSFTIPVSTANGRTMAARIKIKELSVGGIAVTDVAALVTRPGDLDTSLLGMSYLGRIGSFSVAGDQLILRE